MISAMPLVAVFCVFWAGSTRDDDGLDKTVPRQTVVKLKPNARVGAINNDTQYPATRT